MKAVFNLGCYTENARCIVQLAAALMDSITCKAFAIEEPQKIKKVNFRKELLGRCPSSFIRFIDNAMFELSQCYARRKLDNEVKLIATDTVANSWHERSLEEAKSTLLKVLRRLDAWMSFEFGKKPVFFWRIIEPTFEKYVTQRSGSPMYIYDTDIPGWVKPITVEDVRQVISDLEKPSYIGREEDQFIIEQKRTVLQEIARVVKESSGVPERELAVPLEIRRLAEDPRLKLESVRILLSRAYGSRAFL